MDRVRRRMAIGIFATVGDLEVTTGRLKALGIGRHECFVVSASETPAELALRATRQDAVDPGDLRDPVPGHLMLRVYLDTPADEQAVARVLLDSAAQSVQLHDVDPSASAARPHS